MVRCASRGDLGVLFRCCGRCSYLVLMVAIPLGLASTVLTFKTLAEGSDEGTNSTVVECTG
jgi:hypothetical protein